MNDTIVALSSGSVPSAIAIIRVSGSGSIRLLEKFLGAETPPHKAVLRKFYDILTDRYLDQGLVLWTPGPGSFTGEDSFEFHCHGGAPIIESLVSTLCNEHSVRLAEPGEFARRAFENGKIDLTQAEGIGDLVFAQSSAQVQLALSQVLGNSKKIVEEWRTNIIGLQAIVEAHLDFSDEDDLASLPGPEFWEKLAVLHASVKSELDTHRTGEVVRDGFTIAIVGAPNVGKSSFLNFVAKRDVAIVTNLPGTTRDLIEVHVNLMGYSVRFVDTAGIRDTDDLVENEGINRAISAASAANLVFHLEDGISEFSSLTQDQPSWLIRTKLDLDLAVAKSSDFSVSVITGEGFEELLGSLGNHIEKHCSLGETGIITRERHRQLLQDACTEVGRARSVDLDLELCAESLRLAGNAIGAIIGTINPEDVLDELFSGFCIGK